MRGSSTFEIFGEREKYLKNRIEIIYLLIEFVKISFIYYDNKYQQRKTT